MQADTLESPLALHRKDAAKRIGLSLASLDRAIGRGEIKAKKYGKRTLIKVTELERYLDALPDLEKPRDN
ncbi:MAG TPA: helix-turn-helix domain-containing protein [Xanthobacteraceae bacterium]|nr:helix-turn-helix domain-containing protein [Xanthobacteraceae bacterium]